MFKKIISAVITTAILVTPIHAAVTEPQIFIYETCDLTAEILESRVINHDIIIERCVGVCLDDEGNGMILNAEHNYISYRHSHGVCEGDVVLSLFTYNPDTDYVDDIIDRMDFVIDAGIEE